MGTGEVAVLGTVAALLGAIIGAAGAILAALAGGRVQLRGQHQQWRREMRRAAYADYLRAAGDYAGAISELNVGHLSESEFGPDEPGRDDDREQATSARVQEGEAYSMLRLEASPTVLKAAKDLHDSLRHWHWRTLEYWDNPDLSHQVVDLTGIDGQLIRPLRDFPRGFAAQADYVDTRLNDYEAAARLDLERPR
ncbi:MULTISPECIES: hypothetical protein [unclassified Streptomyces]|nr:MULTISPECIES: hypothetical protein [unclassified Streptomyces]NEA00983.1 hypothetical protein [Streptomyces sp. SID10116]MYY82310.1 hypothetical protein [Streptomyces sp. SID335]MYZ19088.1 hypothetical protein [Streptomyces sp. SID337]NDZ89127.1 hypothetical protein [Streptomyces sp. SID10115]NEB44012.1 hypothetical protein [Streptomyces sp. SID339]